MSSKPCVFPSRLEWTPNQDFPPIVAASEAPCCLQGGSEGSVELAFPEPTDQLLDEQGQLLPETDVLPAGYAQLLSVGLIMISLHCAGMCGPIMLSLRFGWQQEGKRRFLAALTQLAGYQLGRAGIYGLFGLCAGLLGQVLHYWVREGTLVMSIVLALAFMVAAIHKMGWLPKRSAPQQDGFAVRLGRFAMRNKPSQPILAGMSIGALLAFMPCMITFWVLGLAAESASWFHGPALMILLVVLTTPVLLFFALAGAAAGRWRRFFGNRTAGVLLFLSALWLAMRALAEAELVPHWHIMIADYMVMFW